MCRTKCINRADCIERRSVSHLVKTRKKSGIPKPNVFLAAEINVFFALNRMCRIRYLVV